jgi:hypothetical protein
LEELKKFNNLKVSGNPFRIDSYENLDEELRKEKQTVANNVIENKKMISSNELD